VLKKTLVALIIIFSLPLNAWAAMQVIEMDNLPEDQIIEEYTVSPVSNPDDELMPTWAVQKEVSHLQKAIPLLNRVNWNVYVINQQISMPSFKLSVPLAGYARRFPKPYKVFLFASPKTNKYTAYDLVEHEIGHLVRYEVISKQDLQEYVDLRNDGLERDGYYDKPDELFAEDFRWLFGSDGSRDYRYMPTYPKPSEKEKEWILNHVLLTWQDKLEYYKIDHDIGFKEILRAKELYDQRKARKDYKGAELAHLWANQVRKAIGIF